MTGTVAGQTVRIMTQKLGEGVFSPSYYWVAEPNPKKAVEIIRLVLGRRPMRRLRRSARYRRVTFWAWGSSRANISLAPEFILFVAGFAISRHNCGRLIP